MVILVRRGRRPTFRSATRQQLAALIEEHGARELSPVPITVGTLLKIAREFGIRLRKGRRPQCFDVGVDSSHRFSP